MLSDDFDAGKGRVGTPNGNSGSGVGNFAVSSRDGGGSGAYSTSGGSDGRSDGPSSFRRCRRGEGPRTELRVLINTKNAGAIIGKGGSNIKRLRESYKSGVTVPGTVKPKPKVRLRMGEVKRDGHTETFPFLRLKDAQKNPFSYPDCSGPERILTITAELGNT